jgi:UPF0755 protein
MPAPRGPSRAVPPRRQRSSLGPFAFLLFVAALVAGVWFVAKPAAEQAVVAYVAEHDTLLRQEIVRSFVADHVRAEIDLAKDTRADSRPFVITRGETAGQIAKRLEEEGVIRSALAFAFVLYETERENALQSGSYTVSPALTPRNIAKLFERAPGEQIVLRIIDGWRLTEVATAVNKAFPSITKEAFTSAAVVGDRKNTVLVGMEPDAPLEGYLFPDTYFMRPDMTAPQIIGVLLDTFERKVGATLRAASAERKVAIYDIVKLASIVEREARDRAESATIAGVYNNRLEIGMKLDADPTIQFALGEWRELSLDDLKLDSPYNTSLYAQLPPTPIANPGAAALEGAARPAEHGYFYFVAKSDGTGGHAFSVTLEEHEANRVKYGNK